MCSVCAYRTKKIDPSLHKNNKNAYYAHSLSPFLPLTSNYSAPAPAPAHILPGNPARSHDSWI